MDDRLDAAIAAWLERKEDEPDLLPGEFAGELDDSLRSRFLAELESLADVDQLATGAAPRDLPVRYGDFRVLGEVGRGAMGVVYSAEQVSTGERVALKVLHRHVAGEERAVARFRREAQTARSLEHRGIVRVLDAGEEDGSAWLAMELIEGRSMQRLLTASADRRDVDHARAAEEFGDLRWMAEQLATVADALEFAHAAGVVHRDVKPANLMVRDGRGGGVVVLDLGLATAQDRTAATLTRTGDFLGTPLYMAPEQAVGAENGTAQSDIYGLGAVLYECLCGRPPVAPGPLAKVIDAILNGEIEDPRKVRPGVPDDLARIALQCLDKEPDRRYQSAAELAQDLRRFVSGESVTARASGPVRRSLRRARRRPWLVALSVTAVLLSAAVVGTMIYSSGQAAQTSLLERDADLRRVPELLGGAPERITVFGGASLRYYATVGLGVNVPTGTKGRSPRAAAALELAEDLAERFPANAEVLRTLAMALLDVGDDSARTREVIEELLALPDAAVGDRAMAAVFEQRQGRHEESERLLAPLLDDGAADVAFWRGLWYQHQQQYFKAVRSFDAALHRGGNGHELDEERRYFALLHRGWCRTCPDVLHLRAAEDDLLQAAALRPAYGTAKLLWAAFAVPRSRR